MAYLRNRFFELLSRQVIIKRNFRMSSKLRSEEALDELKSKNPYFNKYAAKLEAMQQATPEKFIERIESSQKKKELEPLKRTYSELLNPKTPLPHAESTSNESTAEIPFKKLSDIMKVELVADKTTEEIQSIWLEYHKKKDVIAATLTTEQFDKLMKRAQQHPVFIFPLPRSEGYEFIMMQFAANSVHFTPLIAYQLHKENAPECLNIVHYTEMKDKNVILMRGEYDSQVCTGQEAQCLANQLQMYYFSSDDSKRNLLEKFTKQPSEFKHMDLIKELEQIELK